MSKEDRMRRQSKQLTKQDRIYLNSGRRVASKVASSIVEYILVIILITAITLYMQNGNLDKFVDELQNAKGWFKPGGLLFNAIIGYLPVLALGCISVYFGTGTFPKMFIGILKYIAIAVWLILVFKGASTSLSLPESISAMGLENLTIGTEGLVRFLEIIMISSILIPIGEFCGARKKHKRALAKKEDLMGL